MSEKLKQLKQHIKENEIDLFFDKINSSLAVDSDLVNLAITLKSKYKHYKTDSIKGILSSEEHQLQRNTLINDLLNMLDLADEDDFKNDIIQKSITYFHTAITKKQNELKEITNKKADGIDKAAYSLIKLGQILSGKKDEVEQTILFDQTLKAASRKVLRRVTIACTEIKALRSFQSKSFKEIIQLYQELVLYLDFPKEKIDAQKIALLQHNFDDIKIHAQKLEAAQGKQLKPFNEILPGIQNFIATKDLICKALQTQLPENRSIQENIDTTYSNFDSVEKLILETVDSLSKIELSDMTLIKQLDNLISELKLNLEEL